MGICNKHCYQNDVATPPDACLACDLERQLEEALRNLSEKDTECSKYYQEAAKAEDLEHQLADAQELRIHQIEDFEKQLGEKDKAIEELTADACKLKEENEQLKATVADRNAEIASKDASIEKLHQCISMLQRKNEELEAELAKYKLKWQTGKIPDTDKSYWSRLIPGTNIPEKIEPYIRPGNVLNDPAWMWAGPILPPEEGK